jgi:hypothetical protein
VLQIRRDAYFLQEPLSAKHRGELGMENLYRNLAIVLLVVRKVDGRHTSGTQLSLDGVDGERTLNLAEGLSHFVDVF